MPAWHIYLQVPVRHCACSALLSACSALLSACSAHLPASACSAHLPTSARHCRKKTTPQRQARGVAPRQDVRPHTRQPDRKKTVGGGLFGVNHMPIPSKIKFQIVSRHAKNGKTSYYSGPYIDIRARVLPFFSAKPREAGYSPRPYLRVWPGRIRIGRQKPCKNIFSPTIGAYGRGECAAEQKKPDRKKKMASWARQRQQITAAPGLHGGAVVLNLRRGPGAYALLSRADGQLTRAGQHYSQLLSPGPAAPQQGLRLQPAPSARAPTIKACASLQRRAPADQAGQGLLPQQVLQVPGPRAGVIRGRRRSGRNAGAGYERRTGCR